MIKILSIIFLISTFNNSQNVDSISNSFHQTENVIKFADYLFCTKDFLRAANEYMRLNETLRDEKINFKIALSLATIGQYDEATKLFEKIEQNSPYHQSSSLEIMKILFIQEKYSDLRRFALVDNSILQNKIPEAKLLYMSYLKDSEKISTFSDFVKPFEFAEQEEIKTLYHMKVNPSSKNPMIASILSAIIPGAGKFYAGEISDGILAFVATGLFSFLAYDNFKADHNFRGGLFSGLAAMFYAGNIYGSYASAQIFNAQVKYEFNLRIDSFLSSKNYFIPPYDFCK